jgi:hypothetical protein
LDSKLTHSKIFAINFNQSETRDFEQDTYAMCMHHNIALLRTKLGAYKNISGHNVALQIRMNPCNLQNMNVRNLETGQQLLREFRLAGTCRSLAAHLLIHELHQCTPEAT